MSLSLKIQKKKELELVRKIRHGNSQAEDELFSCFIEQISWKVRLRLGFANEDWQDVAGEAILAALISLRQGKFNAEKGNLGYYIYGITQNKIFDYFKKKKKLGENVVRMDDVALSEFSTEEELTLEKQETFEKVKQSIDELPSKYRDVLHLALNEELSIGQISQQMKIPSEDVSKRLWYGKQLLKRHLSIRDLLLILWLVFIIYNWGLG